MLLSHRAEKRIRMSRSGVVVGKMKAIGIPPEDVGSAKHTEL